MAATETIKKILSNTDAENRPVGTIYLDNSDYINGSKMHELFRDDEGVWHAFCQPKREATYSYMGKRVAVTCPKCRLTRKAE